MMLIEATVKTYILFGFAGIMFMEESQQEVFSRDVSQVNPPKGAITFRFADQTVAVTPDGEELRGNLRNWSPRFWIGGELVKSTRIPPDDKYRILRSNAKNNGWKYMVRFPNDTWQPFETGDQIWQPKEKPGFDPELWKQSL